MWFIFAQDGNPLVVAVSSMTRPRHMGWKSFTKNNHQPHPRRARVLISLLKLGDRHFVLEWEQGLTERQDNEFYSQPVEVGNPTEREIVPRKRDWYDAAGKIVFTQDA